MAEMHSPLRREDLQDFFAGQPRILEWGIAKAGKTPNAERLQSWVGQGQHGKMEYMATRLEERMNPQVFHPWAQSVVVFSFPYARRLGDGVGKTSGGAAKTNSGATPGPSYRVAAYAGAKDYHDEARVILKEAEEFLKTRTGRPDLNFYGFVDTAPIFERDLATEAGLGWRGKNCCTLSREQGSSFHLAGFLLDAPLPVATPSQEFCGGCTRCLDQCPTDAFVGPGHLDATKCISYWTIEAKSDLPSHLTPQFGGWIFGCDICQEVCPWNHKSARDKALGEKTRNSVDAVKHAEKDLFPVDGLAWLRLLRKGGGFQSRFRHSPLLRAGRKSLLRNLAMAASNLKDTSLLNLLLETLPEETDPIVRKEIEKAILILQLL